MRSVASGISNGVVAIQILPGSLLLGSYMLRLNNIWNFQQQIQEYFKSGALMDWTYAFRVRLMLL